VASHSYLALLLLLTTFPLCAQSAPASAPPDSKAVPKQPTPTVVQPMKVIVGCCLETSRWSSKSNR